MTKLRDLTGEKFGRLLVLERVPAPSEKSNKSNAAYWRTRCDCGNEKIVVGYSLRDGITKSCGCLQREGLRLRNSNRSTHNLSDSRTYRIWKAMRQRCSNKNRKGYENYGAKGIKVCERWIDSFENFVSDMGECPDGMTLERKDNSSGYSKENCVWASKKEQAKNRSTNVFLTYNGQTKCATEWAEIYNIKPVTLFGRLKSGWSIEKALTTEVKKKTTK